MKILVGVIVASLFLAGCKIRGLSNKSSGLRADGSELMLELGRTGLISNSSNSNGSDPMDAVNSVAFSPDGTLLASASKNAIKIMQVDSGDGSLMLLEEKSSESRDNLRDPIAFSPDGSLLASGTELFAVDPQGSTVLSRVSRRKNFRNVRSVAFSPDGSFLVVLSMFNIELFSVDEKRLTHRQTIEGAFQEGAISIAFSPDGSFLVSIDSYDNINFFDLDKKAGTLKLTKTLKDIFGPVVAFSPNGNIFVTGGFAGIKSWGLDPETKALNLITEANVIATSLAFSPDGKYLVSSGSAGLKVWGMNEGLLTNLFDETNVGGFESKASSVVLSPRGLYLGVGMMNGDVAVWDGFPFARRSGKSARK